MFDLAVEHFLNFISLRYSRSLCSNVFDFILLPLQKLFSPISRTWNNNDDVHEHTYVKSQIHAYCAVSHTSLWLRTDIRPSQRATTSSSPPLMPCSSLIFHQFSNLGWSYSAVSVMQTHSSFCTSSVASLLGICCTYVMTTHLISPTGTRPPGSGFAASCEGPSNFRGSQRPHSPLCCSSSSPSSRA